ncbi:putative ribonuclease H-like domain-containing protein [Tanacetum coccineum]|uniref:Ribonuclease H-like domain-containing protein n=1 Tax=Tanacetum coccineum TaxID=301880 RepID=A0ABQ4XF55_9ASTR
MSHPHPKRSFVPQAVLTRSGKLSTASAAVNTVRPVNTANTKAVNTARPVNTAASKQTVNHPRPINNTFKRGYSQSSRPFNRYFANKNSITKTNVNTVSVKHTTARDRAVVRNKGKGANAVKASACWDNPQQKEYKEKAVIDSGCSRHMTGNKCYLDEYEDYDGGFVSFGDGKGRISGKGKIKTGSLDFEDVYFCKELKYNLFSVSQICDKKNNVLFTDTECLVLSSDFKLLDESQVLLRVPRKDNIYSVDLKNVVPTGDLTCLIAKAIIDESNTWHMRLGHINFKTMNKLVKGNLVKGLPSKIFENDHSCVACQKGKQHKASYKTKLVNSISKPLHMLHMDLFGPTNVKSLMRKSYCLVVTDDFKNQLDHKVKVIRCDNGTEFKNSIMNQFCEMKGIKREFSVARTPQQNGVAERKNRTLIEAARTMLVDSKLPTTFWAEAVNTACYVLNRVLVIKPHNKTPYELIRGRPPLIDFMKPFGCPVTILNTRDHLGKFDGKADEGYFVGYSMVSKVIRVFNKRTRIVEETLNIRFLENTPNVKGNGQAQKEKEHAQEFIMIPICTTDPLISQGPKDRERDIRMKPTEVVENEALDTSRKDDEATRSDTPVSTARPIVDTAVPSPPVNTAGPSGSTTNAFEEHLFERFSPFKNAFSLPPVLNISSIDSTGIFGNAYDDEDVEEVVDMKNVNSSYIVPDTSFTKFHKDHPEDQEPKKVLHALEDPSWVEAMRNELLQFKLLNVWTLVELPRDKWAIGTKWVLRNKKGERGIVVNNKARLVAQGHTQEEGINYDEVFAPVARIEAIRLFLAYASFKDFVVYQMDVKSAFLYGKIQEEVYVCQPPGFEDPHFPNKVYKVEKALYGLHQAPRAWYETLSTYLLDNGFHRGQIDKTLFIRIHKDDILLVQVYVDDIIFGSTKKEMIKQKSDEIFISQDKYVAEILKKFDFALVKKASTPMETNKPLIKDEEAENVDVYLYRSMIGSLMYLTASRPDIMLLFVLVQGSKLLQRFHTFMIDYAGASLDRKSTTGGCQFLGKRLISWQCKKQTIVATQQLKQNMLLLLTVMDRLLLVALLLFWATAEVKTVNEMRQLQALIDKKEEVDKDSGHPTNSTQVPILDQPSTSSKPKKKQPSKKTQRQEAEVSQDETEHEESVPTPSNDPQPSGEDSMQLTDLMVLCTKLQTHVLDLEKSKDAQANEITALKKRIQRLERKKMSRTTGLKRLEKVGMSRRVESSKDQESLGAPEDASKQGRILDADEMPADDDVTLVDETQERQDDELMFDTGVLDADEMLVEAKVDEKNEQSTKLNDSTAGEAVTTASVEDSAAPTTIEEITLAQTLTPQEVQPSISKDKGKGIIIDPEVPLKRKDQIALDEQIARDIQAKVDAKLIEEQQLQGNKKKKPT